ncbi:ABA4-like family protein [Runella salmonicolor]|uniref:ABA4-like family protein n=1 Tax=Runella salmonicolor TaxID=2950278 RepID=A0ABT1FR49_9BACT|nr:ABA4-like family protein [Runella salmonicolor]MCP1383960.1 ABA4-like family protein [Runella salmonicolor]
MIETAFQIANVLVFPQWLLMIVAPRWRVTQWLVRSYLIPVLLACMYAYFIFSGGPLNFNDFSTFEGVKSLFSKGGDGAVLAGWIHYLAFDLVAGSFVLKDSQEKNIPHGWIILPLFFCFMLGPIGLLAYWVIRTGKTRQVN